MKNITIATNLHLPSALFRMVLAVLLCVSFHTSTFAQTLSFNSFDVDDGLPSSYVTSITQDRSGNIWISTINGVAKFNGRTFVNYYRKDGLADNRIKSSLLDSKGRIWFGHEHGEVTLFDGQTFRVVNGNGSITDQPILTIAEDRKGNMWFGTLFAGVWRYNGVSFEQFSLKNGLSGDAVFSIMIDKQENYWFGTENGITKCPPNFWNGKSGFEYFNKNSGLPSNFIRSIIEDKTGAIWIGTRESGVIKSAPLGKGLKDGKYSHYTTKDGLADNFTIAIAQDSHGAVWVATYGGGVSKFQTGSGKVSFRTFSKKSGLNNNYVQSVFEDHEGNMWFGTSGGGITQFKGEKFKLYGEKDGLSSKMILAVSQDEKGFFWFGTDEGLVQFIPSTTEGGKSTTKKFTKSNGLSSNQILSIFQDNGGALWLGTKGGGVNRLDPKNGSVQIIGQESGLEKNVFCIAADNNNNLWFGTDNRGVYRYNPIDKSFQIYTKKEGLPSNSIKAIFKDSKGNLWFATDGGGLGKFDGKSFSVYDSRQGMNALSLTSIIEDNNSNLWIGSEGGGLYKFNGTSFEHFNTKDGLSSDNIHSLIYDNKHTIWVGTSSGVDKFDINSRTSMHFGKEEGFLGAETNPNAVHKDKDGNIWFGTVSGVVKYNAQEDNQQSVEPIAVIVAKRLFSRDTTLPENAHLSYNQNYLTFEYEGISLRSPKSVRFQYRLDGYDRDWSLPTDKRSATYSDLPPGKYAFKVRASLNNDIWITQPAVYEFEIYPAFWQTAWFITLIVLATVAVVFGIAFARIRKVKKENEILEMRVTQRTHELAERTKQVLLEKEAIENINRELEASREKAEQANRAKSEFLANVTHELRTPLNSILGFTRRLLKRNADIADTQSRSALEIVFRNSENLLKLINDILDLSKVEAGKIAYKNQEINPVLLCQQVVKDLHPLALAKNLKLKVLTTDEFTMYCDADRLQQILLNIVSNGIKFTSVGSVSIELKSFLDESGQQMTCIKVTDTGIGIPPEKLSTIFVPFEQVNPLQDQAAGGIGLGLSIAKRLAMDMNGDIKIISDLDKGSCFEIILPSIEPQTETNNLPKSDDNLIDKGNKLVQETENTEAGEAELL